MLEIGCSNGAMFQYFGFAEANYRGVDFSPQLLAAFKAKHPRVDVECCEGSSYIDKGSKYDLIFSNEVVQFFDMSMLDRHFACARVMMHENSLFVCASVLWKVLRSKYRTGLLTGNMAPNILGSTKCRIRSILCGDSMGYWYDLRDIAHLAERHGFAIDFYGSLMSLYRFHAVMKLDGNQR